MQGCKFTYEFIQELDEREGDKIIEFYLQHQVLFRKSYNFLVLPFNREYSINFDELLKLIESKQIYIQKGQLMLLMIKLINMNFILKDNHFSQSVFSEFSNIWIENSTSFYPHNQSHEYKIIPVNLKLIQEQDDNEDTDKSIMKLIEKLASLTICERPFQKKWSRFHNNDFFFFDAILSQFSMYLQERIDMKTQQKQQIGLASMFKSKYDEKPYQAKFNIELFLYPLNNNLNRHPFISNLVLRSIIMYSDQNQEMTKTSAIALSNRCDQLLKIPQQKIQKLQQRSSQLFHFQQHIKKLQAKLPIYKGYHKLLLSIHIKELYAFELGLIPILEQKIFQKISEDYKQFLQDELKQIIQIVLDYQESH